MKKDANNEESMGPPAGTLRAYLLGQLPDSERQAVEERYFANDEWFALLQATEDDLIDDYVRETLTLQDRKAFETAWLTTAQSSERVAFARELLVKVRANAGQKESWIRSLVPVRGPSRLGFAAVSLTAVLALVFVYEARKTPAPIQIGSSPQVSPAPATPAPPIAEQPASRPPQLPKTAPSPTPTVLAVELLPGIARGGGTRVRIVHVPQSVSAIRMHLRFKDLGYKTYAVRIETVEGNIVWTMRQVSANTEGLFVTLPVVSLPDGDYILKLSSADEAPHQGIADYLVRIVREKPTK
jgi:hypothetical protein